MSDAVTIYSACCGKPLYDTTATVGETVGAANIVKVHPGMPWPENGAIVKCPECGQACDAYATVNGSVVPLVKPPIMGHYHIGPRA